MIPPQIDDAEGFPFQMIGRVPYRPESFEDWCDFVLGCEGTMPPLRPLVLPFHESGDTDA